jgi:hypothetical protein
MVWRTAGESSSSAVFASYCCWQGSIYLYRRCRLWSRGGYLGRPCRYLCTSHCAGASSGKRLLSAPCPLPPAPLPAFPFSPSACSPPSPPGHSLLPPSNSQFPLYSHTLLHSACRLCVCCWQGLALITTYTTTPSFYRTWWRWPSPYTGGGTSPPSPP